MSYKHPILGFPVNRFMPYHESDIAALDIETEGLDVDTGVPIISVALTILPPSSCKDEGIVLFKKNMPASEGHKLGFKTEPGVLEWFATLPKDVQEAARENPVSADEAIGSLIEVILNHQEKNPKRTLYIFGNAPEFDQKAIEKYVIGLGFVVPWIFWQNRDFRTLAGLGLLPFETKNQLKEVASQIVGGHREHDALWDATYECLTLRAIVDLVRKMEVFYLNNGDK